MDERARRLPSSASTTPASAAGALLLTLAVLSGACLGGAAPPAPAEEPGPSAEELAAAQAVADAEEVARRRANRPPPVAPRTPPREIPGSPPSLVGRQAPSVELALMDGGSSSVEELRGSVVILTFWASWCGPCRKEMPELNEQQERLKDRGLTVIGVNVDKSPASARRWAAQNPIRFPVMLDSQAMLMGEYHVSYMPTLFVIDRAGVVRRTQVGYKAERLARTMEFVESLL